MSYKLVRAPDELRFFCPNNLCATCKNIISLHKVFYMQELIFLIKESPEGGFEAEALGVAIFTEAEDWDELKKKIREAVSCHFDDDTHRIIRMHFVKEEVLTA